MPCTGCAIDALLFCIVEIGTETGPKERRSTDNGIEACSCSRNTLNSSEKRTRKDRLFSLVRLTWREHEANDKYRYTNEVRRLTALTGARTQQKEKRGCAQVATSVAAKGQGRVKCLLARRIILLLTGERLCRIDFKSLSVTFVSCRKKQWLDREKCYQWEIYSIVTRILSEVMFENFSTL